MSQVPNKKPSSPFITNNVSSVGNNSIAGTNFSIYGIGGYMEVMNISDLYFTIPSGTTGQVKFSGNTIPINFSSLSNISVSAGTATTQMSNVLVLNSDNISSGRRKLGMLVYVYETNQIYQFNINNYDSLWSAATASTGTVVTLQYGTIVQGNSAENNSFINAWTGNTIEGISGETSATAVWKKLTTSGGGGGSGITGGTYYPNTLTLDLESTGGTISVGNVTGLYISAGTYTSGTSTIDLFNSTGGTVSITGVTSSSIFTGLTQVNEATRTGLTPSIGYMVYQTDGSDGVYVYKASGWVQMI